MNYIELLSKTKAAFVQHRSGGRRHYTSEQKSDALLLLNHYSVGELSRALGVSIKCLINWKEAASIFAAKSPQFLPVMLSASERTDVLQAESLILKLPHQIELVLPATSSKERVQFIASLIKELSACSI